MRARSSGILADHASYGLACRTSELPAMERAHRHDEVEVDFAVGGAVTYEHRGRPVVVPAGSVLVTWAAHPHRVAAADAGAVVRWLTVPLRDVLGWSVGGRLTDRLLAGQALVLPARPDEQAAPLRWEADLATDPGSAAGLGRAVRLEAQALLERLAVRAAAPGATAAGTGADPAAALAAAGAAELAERFREPLTVAELARSLHVHPATAAAAFRRVLGVTPGHYLRQCRLAEAQRLLLCTALPVAEIAARSGFGSLSAFYAAFTAELGVPPHRYRRAHDPPPTGP